MGFVVEVVARALARALTLLVTLGRPEVSVAPDALTDGPATLRLLALELPGGHPAVTKAAASPLRYRVAVEAGLEAEAEAFGLAVYDALGDPAGWAAAGRALHPTTDTADFTVLLATPGTTDRLCAPLRTGGSYSCGRAGRAVINLRRWRSGASTWADDLEGYRRYVINHEVGHLLRQPHRRCPEAGAVAPVMVQQTISLEGCERGNRPTATELERLRARWARQAAG